MAPQGGEAEGKSEVSPYLTRVSPKYAAKRRHAERRLAAGQCLRCAAPVIAGRSICAAHIAASVERMRRSRERAKAREAAERQREAA